MAQTPISINSAQPIVNEDGAMSDVFRVWMLQVTRNVPYVGTGSPEGVIEAPQYSLYIDEAIPTVPVQYRKMLPEIGGDRSKGWVVV